MGKIICTCSSACTYGYEYIHQREYVARTLGKEAEARLSMLLPHVRRQDVLQKAVVSWQQRKGGRRRAGRGRRARREDQGREGRDGGATEGREAMLWWRSAGWPDAEAHREGGAHGRRGMPDRAAVLHTSARDAGTLVGVLPFVRSDHDRPIIARSLHTLLHPTLGAGAPVVAPAPNIDEN